MQELYDWIAIFMRWGHVLAAITWIGTSFYFNWFDLSVRNPDGPVIKKGIRGTLHEIHGGSFYYHEQYWPQVDHPRMLAHSGPAQLTFLTGLILFILLYWWNADTYLLSPAISLPKWMLLGISILSLILAWPIYYSLVRIIKDEFKLFLILTLLISGCTWSFIQIFSARGAFLQIGAMMGTIMALSVHFVIVPNHIKMKKQIQTGEQININYGAAAKRVSSHNNYLTLPVLFAMLSIHFSPISAHRFNWLLFILLMLAGVALRHWRNIKLKTDRSIKKFWIAAVVLAGIAFGMSLISRLDQSSITAIEVPSDEKIHAILKTRCSTCHSITPTDNIFTTAPLGLKLDTLEEARLNSDKIINRAVLSNDMPMGNITNMTDDERKQLGAWLKAN